MYSYEDRVRAVELYLKLGKRIKAVVIQRRRDTAARVRMDIEREVSPSVSIGPSQSSVSSDCFGQI
ncbi:hypothetical protein ABLT15_36600 [Paraburkholderia tropica]|uniref:hypothetical protein n=1 Tax=Paraburkholderia tropica TaxID=92647 RepID=UPI0032B4697D